MRTFLKRLELQGFKSFAPKTIFEFPARVTAIVGPNGSGKSNVIDAFRWVLGEREAKQLRGDTLDNLIFAGTPKRPAASLAKVALYFDNETGAFETGGEEVMLIRRADRSGSSQFLFHDTEIKLKDLLPVLARARLGSRGLTMVGQGQSDVFVKSSPEERRAMIEEVLGLREFRIKKAQAERRLVSSAVHMDKVRAMIEEIAPHLRFLRKQRSRWDRRSEIANNLVATEDRYFAFRYYELLNEKTAQSVFHGVGASSNREELIKTITTLEQSLANLEEQAQRTVASTVWREKINKYIDERSQKEKELARLEARMELGVRATPDDQKLRNYTQTLRLLLDEIRNAETIEDITTLREMLKQWLAKITTVLRESNSEEQGELADQVHVSAQEIATIDAAIKTLQKEEEEELRTHDEKNREFRDRIRELETKKNELRVIDEAVQRQRFEQEKITIRIDELLREWENVGRVRGELEKLSPPKESVDCAREERQMFRLRGELAAIGEIDEGLVQEAEETESRYEFLSKELEDLMQATKDLTQLIKDLNEQIHKNFKSSFRSINDEFNNHFRLMFGGGKAHLKLTKKEIPKQTDASTGDGVDVVAQLENVEVAKEDHELSAGVEVEVSLPRKRITSLEMLSGGEKTLVSIAALFALIAVSPPPFLVLDEIDASLDEENARRFAELVKDFSKKTQFIIVTHNRATMEAADVLYGITMGDDGVSTVLSLKVET